MSKEDDMEKTLLLQKPSKLKSETVQAKDNDFSIDAISAMDEQNIKTLCITKSFCLKYITIMSILIIVEAIIGVSFFAGVAIYSVNKRNSYLGIASDVIQCAQHYWSTRFSTMIIKQNNSDSINDNPQGLDIDVFSLNQQDLIFHDLIDDHTDFEIVLPTTGVNRFIVPYNYYNRPWYLWVQSTISMEYDMDFTEAPTQAHAYLYKGEKAINDFFADSQTQPNYEEKIDLITTEFRNISWTARSNDYYFVAVEINGKEDTIFKANISFTILYIDVDDYAFLPTTSKKLVGVGDGLRLGWSRSSNLTLCYLHPQEDPLYSNSIHLDISYQPSVIIPATTAPVLGCVLVYVVCLIILCVRVRYHSRKYHKGYTSINSIIIS